MARARNIKPAFFTNDELAENDPLGRILFIGLWTIADHNGNLEWKPRRVKAQILPYDNCDIEKLAINLDKSGFIRFYSDGDKIMLNITNFTEHQNPHKNEREKGSKIPPYSESKRQAIDLKGLTINLDKSGLKPDDSHSDRADSLIPHPDSLNLIPDCGNGSETPKPKKPRSPRFTPPTLDQVAEYMTERNLEAYRIKTESEKYFDYYSANGWKAGRNPMKDWKASVRNWLNNNYSQPKQSGMSFGRSAEDEQKLAEWGFSDSPVLGGRVIDHE